MQRRKMWTGAVAAFLAALALVLGTAGVARAAIDDHGNKINGVIEEGREAINGKMKDDDGTVYASIAWDAGSPTATGGSVTTTISGEMTIADVRDDILDTLVSYLNRYSNLVSKVSLAGDETIMGTPLNGKKVELEVTGKVQGSEVNQFAKECFGPEAYEPGMGISVLNKRSFTIDVTANTAAGSKVQNCSYTMTFVVQQPGEDTTPPTPGDVQGSVVNDATNNSISGALEGIGTVQPPAQLDGGDKNELTWTVEIQDSTQPVSKVSTGLIGQILSKTAVIAPVGSVAKSLDDSSITLSFTSATGYQEIDAFALKCLQAASRNATTRALGVGPMAAVINETGALIDRTCSIEVTFGSGATATTTVYHFAFQGDVPENTKPVYRVYNPYDQVHLWTQDRTEFNELVDAGWNPEPNASGISWYAPATQGDGVYVVKRLYNPFSHDHYYIQATNTSGIEYLKGLGWVEDSSASDILSAPASSGSPVYTFWNPFRDVDTHMYTPDAYEAQVLPTQGWDPNDTAIYAVKLDA